MEVPALGTRYVPIWLSNGDRNTSYLQAKAETRRRAPASLRKGPQRGWRRRRRRRRRRGARKVRPKEPQDQREQAYFVYHVGDACVEDQTFVQGNRQDKKNRSCIHTVSRQGNRQASRRVNRNRQAGRQESLSCCQGTLSASCPSVPPGLARGFRTWRWRLGSELQRAKHRYLASQHPTPGDKHTYVHLDVCAHGRVYGMYCHTIRR